MDATHAHTKRFQICATETPREWWGRILAFHEPNEPQPLRDEYDTIIGTIIKPSLLGTVWCQSVMERFERSDGGPFPP